MKLFTILFFLISLSAPLISQADLIPEIETDHTLLSTPFTNASVEEFAILMNEKNVIVLDVRTPRETALGIIEGAIEIDIKNPSFVDQINKLDKDKTYLVYCRSGRRSVTACNAMSELGFGHLYNLVGGYGAWVKGE